MRNRFSAARGRRGAATVSLAMFTLGLALPASGSLVLGAQALAGPDSMVGSTSGPPAPPAVPGSRVDILADPPHPGPGESTQLTVTISGSRGSDRYAVTGTRVDLALTEKPDDGSTLSTTRVTTDLTGSATVKLTLSRTRGRNVVTATSGGISNQVLVDTLAGAEASAGRARHSNIVAVAPAPAIRPEYLVAAAVLMLLGSFLLPHQRRKVSSGRRTPRARGSASPGGSPGRPRSAGSSAPSPSAPPASGPLEAAAGLPMASRPSQQPGTRAPRPRQGSPEPN